MPNPYREIFKAPGAKGFAAAGFVARLPIAMATIGIVAMLSQTHGEYWLAGAVSATFALTNAFVAPQISRLVDRHGQTPVLVPATTLSVAAFAVLMLAAHYRLADLDAVCRQRCWRRAMPSMPAMVQGALDGALPRHAEAQHGFRLRVGRRRTRLYRRIKPGGRALRHPVPGSRGAGIDDIPRRRLDRLHPAEIDRAQGTSGRKERRRFGDQAALGADHHLHHGGNRRDLRYRRSDRHRHGEGTSVSLPRPASCSAATPPARSSLASSIGALKLKAPLSRQFAAAVAIVDGNHRPAAVRRQHSNALALALFISGVAISPTFITAFGLVERHRAGGQADRRHHLGEDGHRHRHGASARSSRAG